jgi:hypothetical protein
MFDARRAGTGNQQSMTLPVTDSGCQNA